MMAVVYAVYHAKDRPEHFNNLALQLSASMLQLLSDLNDKSTDFIKVDVIFIDMNRREWSHSHGKTYS